MKSGTAQTFSMDLEGERGPYPEPQRIEPRSAEQPLDRLERQLADYKAGEAVKAAEVGYPIGTGEWPRGYTDALKLRVIEGNIDWTEIDEAQKEAVLSREIDFAKITREQLNFVYEDIASERYEELDERPARRLFDEASYANSLEDTRSFEEQLGGVRPSTRDLIVSVMFDAWPRNAAVVDFGLDSQRHYESLYYPIRNDEIAPAVLDAAMGHGQKLTDMTRAAHSNPHKDVVFHTSWDGIYNRPKPEGAMPDEAKLKRTLDSLATKSGYNPAANFSPDEVREESKEESKGRTR